MAESTLPTPSTSCMEFKRNLRIGDSGDDVKKMQDILVKAGYKPDTDGKYGEKTAAAVSAFQETFSAEILYPLGLQNGTGFLVRQLARNLISSTDAAGRAFCHLLFFTRVPLSVHSRRGHVLRDERVLQ